MSVTARAGATGNPPRRDLLLRSLRSNLNATILTVWTVVVGAVGVAVLVDQLGLARLFDPGTGDPARVGRALAQWWIVTITAGMCFFAPVTAVLSCAANGERARLQGWMMTLVPPRRIVSGIFQAQLAMIALALVLALPVAAIALAYGGTNPAQLGVGLAGAALTGAATGLLATAIACRSNHVFRPLIATSIIVVALFAIPFALHQTGSTDGNDSVLTAVPIVAVADAAAPRMTHPDNVTGAADAPVDHLAATQKSWSGQIPPWGLAAGGALVAMALLAVITRVRIARPPRG